jgi:cytochrome c oxidase subunit 4
MSERSISPATYFVVCGLLILLTFLTLAVSFLEITGLWHIVIGLTIAVCKAALVILFFMHVVLNSRLTWCVIIIAIFWVGILFSLTLADYFSRGLIPYTPGH